VATNEPGGAGDFVNSLGDKVVATLQATQSDRVVRKSKLHAVFTESFDVQGMARFAVGRYWSQADEKQRGEYLKLFGDYVAGLYADKFAEYTGQTFEVSGQRPLGNDMVAVQGSIIQPGKPPTRVEFRVRKDEGGYRIADVYVEGLSLLITKRDEFMTVIAREGMDGLLKRLKNAIS
jgi:phospholipid transport system substrate-binding protein